MVEYWIFCLQSRNRQRSIHAGMSEPIKCYTKWNKSNKIFSVEKVLRTKLKTKKREKKNRTAIREQTYVTQRKAFCFWLKFNLSISSLWLFHSCLDGLSSETYTVNKFVTANRLFSVFFKLIINILATKDSIFVIFDWFPVETILPIKP